MRSAPRSVTAWIAWSGVGRLRRAAPARSACSPRTPGYRASVPAASRTPARQSEDAFSCVRASVPRRHRGACRGRTRRSRPCASRQQVRRRHVSDPRLLEEGEIRRRRFAGDRDRDRRGSAHLTLGHLCGELGRSRAWARARSRKCPNARGWGAVALPGVHDHACFACGVDERTDHGQACNLSPVDGCPSTAWRSSWPAVEAMGSVSVNRLRCRHRPMQ
jgi:hypothetical protein